MPTDSLKKLVCGEHLAYKFARTGSSKPMFCYSVVIDVNKISFYHTITRLRTPFKTSNVQCYTS